MWTYAHDKESTMHLRESIPALGAIGLIAAFAGSLITAVIVIGLVFG